ncbi:MAG: DNA-processing protein DprA [Eggerthellaceae bacterium]
MRRPQGICVISGGARGCDSYAHEAAIEAGGRTVAFLGGAATSPFVQQRALQPHHRIGRAVVSSIRGASQAVYVSGAQQAYSVFGPCDARGGGGGPSGTFSTADEALAANKDVLAVPVSIFSPTSRGSNALIAQGAGPVVDEAEFEELLTRLFPEKAYPNGRAAQLTMLFSREEGGCAAPSTGGSSSALKACDDADGLVISALRADPMRLENLV